MQLTNWTERRMLDLLNQRYGKTYANGAHPLNRYVGAEHVRAQAGFDALRTADYVAMDVWPGYPHGSGLAYHGHEVKVSRSDWLTELRDPDKAEAFRPYMDYWWLVVPDAKIVRPGELPEGWGLMAVGSNGALRVRTQAPRLEPEPMPKTMIASFLRAAVKTERRRHSDESTVDIH